MTLFIKVTYLFSIIFPFYFCDENPVSVRHDIKKRLNVVIFFTHVDPKCVALQKDTLGFLNLHEETRIKHSSDEQAIANQQQDNKTGSAFCKEFLKDALMKLTHFCHTVMKMKTAIASVSGKERTNDIQEPENPFHEEIAPTQASRLKRSNAFKNIKEEQYAIDPRPPRNKMIKSHSKNVITGTKHTEVFQIRVKRNVQENIEETSTKKSDIVVEIVDNVPTENPNKKHPWDVLDIVKHVRYSFLGNLFQDTLKKQIKADQEDLVDISKLGKEKQDAGLFSMVKSTLDALQDPPESTFLMVIFGGHLRAVTDKHSAIVLSIKYVIENTDTDNTLVIVTGSCADDSEKLVKENEARSNTMPVYAKGPHTNLLANCSLLYDIPLAVRKILEAHVGTGFHFQDSPST